MGCQHYGDRGGAEWCSHYSQPIRDLKTAPVQPGEEVVVEVDDIHESGAGVGRTDDGFIVMVDGVLPEARAKVKITSVKSNHARADELERLPMDEDEDQADEGESAEDGETADEDTADDGEADETEADETEDETDSRNDGPTRPQLGSRDNFWGS